MLTIIASIISVTIPSKKDLKFIIGGGVVLKGIESASQIEGLNKLPKNLVAAANKFLEDVAKEKK